MCCVGLAGPCHHGGRTKQAGAEAMRKLSDIWLIGSKLAKHLQVRRLGLCQVMEVV